MITSDETLNYLTTPTQLPSNLFAENRLKNVPIPIKLMT